MKKGTGAEIYTTTAAVCYLLGFGFSFLVCLRAFIFEDVSVGIFIAQFFMCSLLGGLAAMVGQVAIAPIAIAILFVEKAPK